MWRDLLHKCTLDTGPALARRSAPRHPHRDLALLLALGFTLRLAFLWHHGGLVLPDAYGRYLPIAEALPERWIGSVFDTPGYPLFLMSMFSLFGKGKAVLAMQCLLGALTVGLAYDSARRLGFTLGAFLLGLYLALHPAGILFSNAILSETLFSFLLAVSVWCFLVWPERLPGAAIIGLSSGLAAITRANGLLACLVFACLFLLIGAPRRRPLLLSAFLLAALLPIGTWVGYNGRHQGLWAIAQGSGWQSLQALAYFDLLRPETLPREDRANYVDWRSLDGMRNRLMYGKDALEATSLDPYFARVARQNIAAQPLAYIAAIPRALLLPRAFIKDTTRTACDPEAWAAMAADAAAHGYPGYAEPAAGGGPFTMLYCLLRRCTIFSGKYSLLLLPLPFAFWLAWRRRNAGLLLIAGLALSQALALTLMLNPIERYYFPLEGLMVLCLAASISLFREMRASPVAIPEGELK